MLSNIVGIVSGGASGLGAATVSTLIRNGAKVVVADLPSQKESYLRLATIAGADAAKFRLSQKSNQEENTTISNQQQHDEPVIAFAETDVTDPEQVSKALDKAEECFGQSINACINCAGIGIARKTLSVKKGEDISNVRVHSLEEFANTIKVNVNGTFNMSRLAAERMVKRDGDLTNNNKDGLRGCIINTASIAGYEGQIGQIAYASSKAAIIGMTLPMARDLSSFGIRVMTIVSVI